MNIAYCIMISLFGECIGMTVVIVNHRIMFFGTPGEISTGNMLCARNAGGQENVAGQTDISITCCVCWAIAFFSRRLVCIFVRVFHFYHSFRVVTFVYGVFRYLQCLLGIYFGTQAEKWSKFV